MTKDDLNGQQSNVIKQNLIIIRSIYAVAEGYHVSELYDLMDITKNKFNNAVSVIPNVHEEISKKKKLILETKMGLSENILAGRKRFDLGRTFNDDFWLNFDYERSLVGKKWQNIKTSTTPPIKRQMLNMVKRELEKQYKTSSNCTDIELLKVFKYLKSGTRYAGCVLDENALNQTLDAWQKLPRKEISGVPEEMLKELVQKLEKLADRFAAVVEFINEK